jgi:hypothetical protein
MPGYLFIGIPLWCPALLVMLPTIVAWRTDMKAQGRSRAGACIKCGYDRAGISTQTVCPECGAPGLSSA